MPSPQQQHTATPLTRRRGSLLGAASDALSSFARKTPHIGMKPRLGSLGRHQQHNGTGRAGPTSAPSLGIHAPQPIVLTEVIEISERSVRASKRQEEEEAERERLRDAAARALGMDDVDVEDTREGIQDPAAADEQQSVSDAGRTESLNGWLDSTTPLALGRPDVLHSRSRSGSYVAHPAPFTQIYSPRPVSPSGQQAFSPHPPRSPGLPASLPPPRNPSTKSLSSPPTLTVNTLSALAAPQRRASRTRLRADVPPSKIPPFPCTNAALRPFVQRSATVPRYYPAPSLLMFALSKQWKSRFLVLTSPLPSPASAMTPTPAFVSPWSTSTPTMTNGGRQEQPAEMPAPSYLHIFKGAGSDERELERLEINEDSVVYVADAEVGGRRGVINVGGRPRKRSQNVVPPSRSNSGSHAGASESMGSRTSSSSMGSEEGASGFESGSSAAGSSEDGGACAEPKAMWVLHIPDTEEAQAWITAIKGAVLSQLCVPTTVRVFVCTQLLYFFQVNSSWVGFGEQQWTN
jgi:hypothetical protein